MRKLLLAIPLLLAACAQGATPSQQFFAVQANYVQAKEEAAAFLSASPLCIEQDVIGCVPTELAQAIVDAVEVTDARMDTATSIFYSVGPAESQQQRAILIAQAALREFVDVRNQGEPE